MCQDDNRSVRQVNRSVERLMLMVALTGLRSVAHERRTRYRLNIPVLRITVLISSDEVLLLNLSHHVCESK